MKRPGTIRAAIALGLAAVLLLAGCAQSTPTTTTGPTATTPPTGEPTATPTATVPTGAYGELRIALSTLGGEGFDPIKQTATAILNMIAPVNDFLVKAVGSDITPILAEKWELAPDGLSWIYTIRKGIKFHNGEDLTADDVKFSFERWASKESYYAWLRDMTEKIEKVDDYTVRVYTKGKQPYIPAIAALASSSPMGIVMPKDYIEQNGLPYYERQPIGTGPFKFVRQVPGDMVEYEALPKHWRQTAEFKKLTVILMPEETTRIASIKTNAVDAIDLGLEGAVELDKAGLRTYALDTMSPMVVLHGAYEAKGAGMPTADIRVRQALSLAIDRDDIIKNFFYDKATAPPPPFLSANAGDIDSKYWMDYAAKAYRYDPAEATKLLKEAGYPNGFNIKLYSFAIRGTPYLPRMAEIVQGYWSKIGVKTEIVPMDWGAFQKLRAAPAPEIIGHASVYRYSAGGITPKNLMAGFHGTSRQYALLAKAYPEVDKMLDDAMSESDDAKRTELVAQALKIITDSYTSLMIAEAPTMAALGNAVDIAFPKPSWSITMFAEIAKHRK